LTLLLTQQGEPTVADQNEAPKLPQLPQLPELPGLLALLGPAANTKVREMIFAYAAQAVREERERCAGKLNLSADAIRLMAGEMSAQEMRAVRAVLAGLAAAIRSQPMPGAALSADDAGGEK
jgi:hypothetical protein